MSFRICKTLFTQRSFSVINKCCRLDSKKLLSQIARTSIGSHMEGPEEFTKFFIKDDRKFCRSFIMNQNCVPVNWENLEKGLNELESTNFRSTILKCCQVLEKPDLAIDYCQYVINKGEKLSLMETCLLIKALVKCEIDLAKYDELVETIFEQFHESIFGIEAINLRAMQVFCRNKNCLKKLLLKYENVGLFDRGLGNLISGLFDNDEPELAWKIANKHPVRFDGTVIQSYLKFCIRMSEQNKFSIALVNDLVNFTKMHNILIHCGDLYEYLDKFVRALNSSEKGDYQWSVDKCEIMKNSLCSSCQYQFKQEPVTAEELELLKKSFLKKVVICSNVNMKTTPDELNNFLSFLDNCTPFDVVIDGLNLFPGLRDKVIGIKTLKFFELQRMRILFIGRRHFKNFSFYRELKEKAQIFLTRNDSLDDVFCLYAAMHQGGNTYFCTSDFLRDHAKFFDDYFSQALFHKWQISHQYLINFKTLKIVQPRVHADMSQSSVVLDGNNKAKEYSWHLSYSEARKQVRIETPAQWICLRAKSKLS